MGGQDDKPGWYHGAPVTCEQHPEKPWPHDDCKGPGVSVRRPAPLPGDLAQSGSVDGMAWAEALVARFNPRDAARHGLDVADAYPVPLELDEVHGWCANMIEAGKEFGAVNPESVGVTDPVAASVVGVMLHTAQRLDDVADTMRRGGWGGATFQQVKEAAHNLRQGAHGVRGSAEWIDELSRADEQLRDLVHALRAVQTDMDVPQAARDMAGRAIAARFGTDFAPAPLAVSVTIYVEGGLSYDQAHEQVKGQIRAALGVLADEVDATADPAAATADGGALSAGTTRSRRPRSWRWRGSCRPGRRPLRCGRASGWCDVGWPRS